MADYNKSILYDYHIESGAKFAPAYTWHLVQHYADGAIEEQIYAEKHAVIFDNSHLTKYRLTYNQEIEKILNDFFFVDLGKIGVSEYVESAIKLTSGQVINFVQLLKMGEFDLFIAMPCEYKKIIEQELKTFADKQKNFAYYDLTYDLEAIYLGGKEAYSVLEQQADFPLDFFSDSGKCGVVTINDYRYIVAVIEKSDSYFACQFFATDDGIEDLWINLYNTDPVKPMGTIAAESLKLDRGVKYYLSDVNKVAAVLQLPSRRQVYPGTSVYCESDENNAIGRVARSYYSPKFNCGMVYAEIDKNHAENKKFMLKSENICIKAEIIKIFDLT